MSRKRRDRRRKSFSLDQCALYKVESKKRLCEILGVSLLQIRKISDDDCNYHMVEIEEEFDELTGRKLQKSRQASVPNFLLKRVHSRVLHLLSGIKPPDYAHGSLAGKSYLTNAVVHVGSREFLAMDLQDYFRSVKENQVYYFFKDIMRCAPDVSGILSRLLTYKGALAVGSPVSSILAMWVCVAMFDCLKDLADENGLLFSTFVDDLTFSGSAIPSSLHEKVESICRHHNLNIQRDKTSFYRNGKPALITGVIVGDGRVRAPHYRFRKIRMLSVVLSEKGRHAIVNGKLARHSLRGGLLEARRVENFRNSRLQVSMV